MSKTVQKAVNQQVANLSVLYEKLHHYHWFVKGPHFFTLHEKFQEDYEAVTELVDEVAERLIQIGGVPVSTLKAYLDTTSLVENQKNSVTAEQMVESLLVDYKQLLAEWQKVIEAASEAEDKVTEDLFIGMSAAFQKKVWLYEAFLGK